MGSKSHGGNLNSGDGASPGKIFIGGLTKDTTYGKKPSQVIVKQGIRLVIHAVSKVKVISYGDGMDAHQRNVDLSKTIIFGI